MSSVMLHGILNMPPEIWGNSEIEKMQRYSTYKSASRRIEDLERALSELLNDCINFDGGKLTDSILENASKVLKEGS